MSRSRKAIKHNPKGTQEFASAELHPLQISRSLTYWLYFKDYILSALPGDFFTLTGVALPLTGQKSVFWLKAFFKEVDIYPYKDNATPVIRKHQYRNVVFLYCRKLLSLHLLY